MTDNPQNVFTELDQFGIDPEAVQLLSENFCRKRQVVVLGSLDRLRCEDKIKVGMFDPSNRGLIDHIESRLNRKIMPVRLNAYEIDKALDRGFTDIRQIELVIPLALEAARPSTIPCNVPDSAKEIVNRILSSAVALGASDIHIETYPGDVDLRFRIDGILNQQFTELSPANVDAVINRIKVLATLDITERRRPQDGRFRCAFEQEGDEVKRIDFRVSTVPSAVKEDIVLRVLDPEAGLIPIAELGAQPGVRDDLVQVLRNPEGMVLVTGPTGSGKTTTLYSALAEIRTGERKIITAEDPIEYHLDKINQKQVSPILPYKDLLRSLLRQDPDVMLFGEIRDLETADIAIAASATGHVVLGTMHTSDAVGAVVRLRGLGIEDADIAVTLLAVVGQRLIRRLCPKCKELTEASDDQKRLLGPLVEGMELLGPKGCPECHNTGYSGRVGIFELLVIDEILQDMIAAGAHKPDIRRQARGSGYRTILEDGLIKIGKGVSSLDELIRVLPYREISIAVSEALSC